jgi:hypothetical protein
VILNLLYASRSENNIEDENELLIIYQNSNCIKYIVAYIVGFVVKKILKHIQCEVCGKEIKSLETKSFLIIKSNFGGLAMADVDVVKICQIAEHIVREYLKISNLSIGNYILKSISLLNINKYFINLTNHFMDQEPLN